MPEPHSNKPTGKTSLRTLSVEVYWLDSARRRRALTEVERWIDHVAPPKLLLEVQPTPSLRPWAQHLPECRKSAFTRDPMQWGLARSEELLRVPCTCGLDDALSLDGDRP